MSKISKALKERTNEEEINFMGGISYNVDPLFTLKMVAASSIFGEASYYRHGISEAKYIQQEQFSDPFLKLFSWFNNKSTTQIFEEVIDRALSYDFEETLKIAVELRNVYNMRLNPQVIMVRAAIHPDREKFTSKNAGKFDYYNQQVMLRPDEPLSQLSYYIFLNKSKKKIPTILKKSISKKLSSLTSTAINKYKNHEIGMINAVRITHANSEVINELMKTGTVKIPEEKQTWEQKRSAGASWKSILEENTLQHMALLKNLRNIFTEIDDSEICKKVMEELKAGVIKGKQFPFRYYVAYKTIKEENVNCLPIILDALEECIDISINNLPKLKGKTVCLSDNSGSAWGCIPTEYGTVKVAEIDNLSSVIAAKCSDEGYVVKFGDNYKTFPVGKRDGTLSITKNISEHADEDVGGGTEGGIWKFFKEALEKKIVYDNIFIYSDQQAGTGELYGEIEDFKEYNEKGLAVNDNYINVYGLILEYRKRVNPKVNVFSIQTAGYTNILIPQNSYRCSLLTGWTGKEILFAKQMIDLFNKMDN